jgi:hypothetical protein
VDTTITPFVVEYDGTPWNQPYSDTAPAAINDLAIALADHAVRLTWSAVTENLIGQPIAVNRYTVYRGDDPEFSPGTGDSIGSTTGTTYDDATPALKNPGVNHYYVVKAVDVSGTKSADSNRVGEFDKGMINGK